MFKVAISVMENIANTCGTTVRARAIWEILKNNYKVLLITRATSLNNKFLKYLKNGNEVKLVKPHGTKLWNLKLMPIILRYRFHCVYCVADIFGFFTYYLLSKFLRYKIIFEAHALAYKEAEQVSKVKSFIYLLLETFIGKKANAIIALSAVTYAFYRRLNSNTFFIPVFVDDKLFFKEKREQKRFSRKAREYQKIVGLIGPFGILPNKYQLEFLYANLDKFNEKIHFMIIGKCDKILKSSKVHYTGYLPLGDYIKTLCQLDAVLVPANFATFGPKNKIIEAMACSLPVFATPQAVIGLDFAKPDENIFVFGKRNLVSKLNELVFNENLLRTIGENARKVVERHYSKVANERKILRILEKITNSEN